MVRWVIRPLVVLLRLLLVPAWVVRGVAWLFPVHSWTVSVRSPIVARLLPVETWTAPMLFPVQTWTVSVRSPILARLLSVETVPARAMPLTRPLPAGVLLALVCSGVSVQ